MLALIVAASLLARAGWLGAPCHQPCRTAHDRVLIFDETYYVDAARVIAGLRPPPGATYARAPLGVDPNAEHPQLAKLLIAGAIELLGDGPLAWRLGSLVFGMLALLGLYALARAAGAPAGVALACVAVMALDNLILVAGRIGTLDIYVLAAMLWGITAYLRGHPWLAGLLIAVAAAFKEVGLLALVVLALCEASRPALRRGPRAWLICAGAAACGFVVLLWAMDGVAAPYDYSRHALLAGGPFVHLWHIVTYGAGQRSPRGPRGIASYPWEWLADFRPIVYLNIDPSQPAPGLTGIRPSVHFLGFISPPILLLGVPVLAATAVGLVRRRARPERAQRAPRPLRVLGLAWLAGTLGPFALLSLAFSRTSYLYYMVIVMPGLYLACGDVAGRVSRVRGRRWVGAWAALLVLSALLLYPLTPLPS